MNEQREKMIELIKYIDGAFYCGANAEEIADALLAEGVIVPPCKVGDTVYWLDNGMIKQGKVFEITIHSDGILVHTGTQYCLEKFFLTKEEAEKALAEREGKG